MFRPRSPVSAVGLVLLVLALSAPYAHVNTHTLEVQTESCARRIFERHNPQGKLCYRESDKAVRLIPSVQQAVRASCPPTNAHVIVLLLGDSTLRNKWEYIKERNGSTIVSANCVRCGMTVCYSSHAVLRTPRESGDLIESILKDLPRSSTYTVAVRVINFGLHHLHLYPARNVTLTPVSELEHLLQEDVILTSRTLSAARAWKHFTYFKLINNICTDNFVGEYASTLARWEVPVAHDSIRDDCYRHFQRTQNFTRIDSVDACEKLVFNSTGVDTLNSMALRVAKRSSHLRILNDLKLTADRCTCSTLRDGRHYPPLVPLWWQSFEEVIERCAQ